MKVQFGLTTPLTEVAKTLFKIQYPCSFPSFVGNPIASDTVQPGDATPLIWSFGPRAAIEQVRWGLQDDATRACHHILGAEGVMHRNCCLIPVSYVQFQVDGGEGDGGGLDIRIRAMEGDWFCIAGIRRPNGQAKTHGFSMLSCEAGDEVRPYSSWQPLILHANLWMDWFNPTKDIRGLQSPASAGNLVVDVIGDLQLAETA